FRPTALDACLPAGSKTAGTASIWQRPAVSQRQRDQFARRQASAAVALARLGKPDVLWTLLKFTPDPRLRTWLIHLLGPVGTDASLVARRLAVETDVAARRALVLSLGKSPIEGIVPSERDGLVEQLVALYRSDPDPGIHSAAEWTLKKWGQKEKLS